MRGILERNPQTFAEAKMAAREMENINKYDDMLWRKEDESISQFITIRPRAIEGEIGGIIQVSVGRKLQETHALAITTRPIYRRMQTKKDEDEKGESSLE
ncbi:hypothetical protein AXG93_1175s1430 [Marchantia polymorpha subsp. ruderalis]|uniref:Uncharacterized protein n=1 Tax=Marchantia polymorpha subsp. ruderalis TaxID=1480154 RepID=A0A176VP12_MARPO|nr:hypothetical protein AXG93_1175s1430 [Marchantia polymorpha subsp. ruderalis]